MGGNRQTISGSIPEEVTEGKEIFKEELGEQ